MIVVARLRVDRMRGLFEQVSVPYEVSAVTPEGAMLSDLFPTRGALVFNPGDSFMVKKIIKKFSLICCFLLPDAGYSN